MKVARRLRAAFDRVTGIPAEQMDLTRIGPRLTQPTLLVHDREDAQAPYADAIELRRAWPAAHTLTTDALGHNRVLADPAVVLAVADFLQPTRH